MGGWVVRVHNARDMSVFHDVPADSLADANETAPLHRRSGVIVKVVKLDGEPEREAEEIEPREAAPPRRKFNRDGTKPLKGGETQHRCGKDASA